MPLQFSAPVIAPFAAMRADLRTCSAAIRRGSKSFFLASMVLPADKRRAAHALYAFCRHSDDAVDDPGASMEKLERLRHRLDLIYHGMPAPIACDRAFARAVQWHAIPKSLPLALLEGFEWDLAGRSYDTIDDLKAYCVRVASTVGLMMSLIMDTGSKEALARAADLGIAMQLTNIARDVGEDARNNRLYLPRDWLVEKAIDPDTLLMNPRHSHALADIIARLLTTADEHYARGIAGIATLPGNCRAAIKAAALIYQAIGTEIVNNGYDSVSRRAYTSFATKFRLVRQASSRPQSIDARHLIAAPADPAALVLVGAANKAFTNRNRQRSRKMLAHGHLAEARLEDDIEVSGSRLDQMVHVFARMQARDRVQNLEHASTGAQR